ncbi:MAG: hypothetical protein P8P74_08780 [Crocinitomicaceae bacterium]|nr:hypothetical protein [Crocinitomicaceae bacterium]
MTSRFLIALLALIAFSFSACDKYEKQQKRIEGNWELISYKFKNQQGLSYYPAASGTMFFENCDDTVCAYTMAIEYTSPQITGTRNEAGKYSLEEEGGRLYLTPIIGGIDQDRISNGMTLLTRTDLQFQYTDDLGRSHHFVFEK